MRNWRSEFCRWRRSLSYEAPLRTFVSALLIGLIGSLLWTGDVRAATYRLGVQDKVRIKVIDWRASKGEYKELDALEDVYTVNPAGAVSLPLVGDIPAEGKTTEELSLVIADTIQKRSGLLSRPGVSVELDKFRPIYVAGEVEHPGEYQFRPNLTVLQAVSIAGGMRRVTEAGLLRLERDRIVATGDHNVARLELRRAIARRARLLAEQQGLDDIPMPPALKSEPDADKLIAGERALMQARADLLRSQVTGLKDVKALYEQEVRSLADKTKSLEREIALVKRNLGNVSSLVQKGLAVTGRELALEQTVGDLEGRLLDAEVASVRAQEEARKADRDADDFKSKRMESVNDDLQKTRHEVEEASAKVATANQLVDEATVVAPRLALERDDTSLRKPVYSILRKVDGKSMQIPADQNADVQPGDVVRVDIKSSRPTSEMSDRPPGENQPPANDKAARAGVSQ
ncbi:MAG TPA: polysaccharide biosynthesis/export family protein [Xanthobacteraceae bacterium]